MAKIRVREVLDKLQMTIEFEDRPPVELPPISAADVAQLAVGLLVISAQADPRGETLSSTNQPSVEVENPALGVAANSQGKAILGLRIGPSPMLLVAMEDKDAKMISDALREVVNTPVNMRFQQKH